MIRKLAFLVMTTFFSINVYATQLSISINHKVIDRKVFIGGVTNLPEGTKVGFHVSSKNGYFAQSYNSLIKSDGTFESEGFSNKGNPLVGSYNVEVISYINKHWQSKEIINKLVKFTGSEIQDDEILIKYSMNIGNAK